MTTYSQPFKSVFGRIRYAFVATIVFGAAVLLPIALCLAMFAPAMGISPQTASLACWSVLGALFLVCYFFATKLRGWLPLERTKR